MKVYILSLMLIVSLSCISISAQLNNSSFESKDSVDGLQLFPITITSSFNSEYPVQADKASFWQGKGFSTQIHIGFHFTNNFMELRILPEFWMTQHLEYDYLKNPLGSTYNDYWWGLDRLQRYGGDYYWMFKPGQSEVSFKYWGIILGFGTSTKSIGPALRQNLLLSPENFGFPLMYLGTETPIETSYGTLSIKFFWGQTRQSSWFDSNPLNDSRLFSGGSITYAFPFLSNFTFGFNRVFHSPWETLDAWKLFQFFTDTVWKSYRAEFTRLNGIEDDVDQLLSVTLDMKYPEQGLRVFGEIGRNDHSSDVMDFLMQPDHSLGWSVGLEKQFRLGNEVDFEFSMELADTALNLGTILRPTGSWYRHNRLNGGYTHDGRLLGAPMGPGSNYQGFFFKTLGDGFTLFTGVERLNFDMDFYNLIAKIEPKYMGYNLSLNWIFGGSMDWSSLSFTCQYKVNQNWNHNFTRDDFRVNSNFEIGIKYRI